MMDYFQGTVETYLRADRTSFYNSEFYLQRTEKYEVGKPNWYVDALNVNFRDETVYLCEATYSRQPSPLRKKLHAWATDWLVIQKAIQRDAKIPEHWQVRVWIFCPEEMIAKILTFMPQFPVTPRITPLEMTLPWKYDNHNRIGEREKPLSIPELEQFPFDLNRNSRKDSHGLANQILSAPTGTMGASDGEGVLDGP